MVIDYKASGMVLAFAPANVEKVDGRPVFIVLVQERNEFCVAKYVNGQSDRLNGFYCRTYNDAMKFFATECRESVKRSPSEIASRYYPHNDSMRIGLEQSLADQ